MANKSIPKAQVEPCAASGSTHGVWLATDSVLDITLDRNGKGFPPDSSHVRTINKMIQDLARASRAVIYQAEHDDSSSTDFLMQPVEGISDTILMLSMFAEAIQSELTEAGARS